MASDHTPTSAWSTDAARDGEHDRQTSRQRKRRLVEIGAPHNYKIGDVVFFGDKGGKILVLAHSGEVGHQVDADECSPTGRNNPQRGSRMGSRPQHHKPTFNHQGRDQLGTHSYMKGLVVLNNSKHARFSFRSWKVR